MLMQIFRFSAIFPFFLMVAACGSNSDNDQAIRDAEQQADQDAAEGGKIECALSGSASFERKCTTDRISSASGQILIVRHPDGGFRRFKVLTDGRGLAPADGFDETHIKVLDNGTIELSSGDDKYRLPARIKSGG